MFYEIEVKGHIRVPPSNFTENTEEAVLKRLNEQFENFVSKKFGIVVAVSDVLNIEDGIIIPGDGAAYHETIFKLIVFKPELQEVVLGLISDITEFGAFMNIGPIDGMIHLSQTMDDYVSFSKGNVLTGSETKKTLKVNDNCRARVVAVSYKDINNPKIGLTMRQNQLGNLNWLKEKAKSKK